MDLEERREWLAQQLGVETYPEDLWAMLVEGHYASANMDEGDCELLTTQAKFFLKARYGRISHPGRSEESREILPWLDDAENERRWVFAGYLADIAADHPGVRRFREKVLGGRWPLTYDEALKLVTEEGFVRGEPEDYPQSVAEELNALTGELSRAYLWTEVNAAWFVLTGYIPTINTFNLGTSAKKVPRGPVITTINIRVEPWFPANKVYRVYKDMQYRVLGKDNHKVRLRRIRLLEFVREQQKANTDGWRTWMKRWNEAYPDWKYEVKNPGQDPDNAVRNLQTDYERACELILTPDYNLPDQDGWSISEQQRQERIRNAAAKSGNDS
jgi:hypothetical protein